MTAARKREAVERLGERHPKVSVRRRCRIVGIGRSSFSYRPKRPDVDAPVIAELQQLARKYPRYGYRRMGVLLRRSGRVINDKRVARLWRQAGLKVPKRKVRRRRLGHSDQGIVRHKPLRQNHVWSYEFVSDQTTDGRRLKILVVMDKFTREVLAIRCARHFRASDVVEVLRQLFARHGTPQHIRSDNGPEFIAAGVRTFLSQRPPHPAHGLRPHRSHPVV